MGSEDVNNYCYKLYRAAKSGMTMLGPYRLDFTCGRAGPTCILTRGEVYIDFAAPEHSTAAPEFWSLRMDEVVLLYGHSDLAKYQSYVEDVIRHAGELLAECNSKEERASQEKRRKAIAKLERLSRLGVNRPAGRQSFWERLRKVYSIWSK